MALPLQIVVGEPLERRCLSCHVASRDHPRRAGLKRAVPQIEVRSDGEDRVRDPWIPRNARIARDMGSAVDVPEPPEMSVVACFLSPRRVGDHVAVLPQEGFYDLEDPGVADRPLDKAAPIEHLVTKWCGLFGQVSSLIGRTLLENPVDIGAERRKLFCTEDTIENDVSLCLKALHRIGCRAGAEREISGRSSEHAPILPSRRGAVAPLAAGTGARRALRVKASGRPHTPRAIHFSRSRHAWEELGPSPFSPRSAWWRVRPPSALR